MQEDSKYIDIDEVIDRLVSIRRVTRKGRLSEAEINALCELSQNVFLKQPMLLNLSAPITVVGDVHGQYSDLIRIFKNNGFPPETDYLFLGDYVDRGLHSIETICLLLAYKIRYPKQFYMLRGNHECAAINKQYGFYEECKARYSIPTWKKFIGCFNCLPAAALIDRKIFACHGGLSPELKSIGNIRKLRRPTDVPDDGLLCDLLWSDPDEEVIGWGPNQRGLSYTFGENVVHDFIKRNKLDLICRAHQVVTNGYEYFADKKLVTIFSAPKYCGDCNKGAVMKVSKNLQCSFKTIT